jgi:hypothetical protein
MRDTRVLYFHGEVSFIPLESEGKVTSGRGHHLFFGVELSLSLPGGMVHVLGFGGVDFGVLE